MDGDHNVAPVEVAAGAASVEVAAGADQKNASAEVAADAGPAENQEPEADGWPDDNVSLAPTDPEAPPVWLNTTMSDQPDTISVGQAPQQNEPTEAERMAQGWCDKRMAQGWCNESCCVRGRGRAACLPHRRVQDRMRDKSIQCD